MFYTYITVLFCFIGSTMSYCNTICKNPFIKVTKIDDPASIPRMLSNYNFDDIDDIDYCDCWDHGEVEWNFPDTTTLKHYYGRHIFGESEKENYKNSVYEKYFKNKLYIRFRKSYVKEAYSIFIKNAYKDVVKMETFAYEFQDLALNNIKGNSVDSDLVMLFIASGLGLIYNKNKVDNIENLKLIQKSINKKEKMENYKTIKKTIGCIFVVLTTIFGRNIRNAE